MSSQVKLRPYQQQTIDELRKLYASGERRALVWLMTGLGKSLIMCHIAKTGLEKGHKTLFIMRRKTLIHQMRDNLVDKVEIYPEIIMGAAAQLPNATDQVLVTSVDTLLRRKALLPTLHQYRIIQVDECQDCSSERYKALLGDILNDDPDKFIVGFTATPYHIGNKGHGFFENIVRTITPAQARDQGYLVPIRGYCPSIIDTTGIATMAGDFDQKALAKRASEAKIVADIVETYQKYGEGKSALVFAVNVAHSKLLAEQFNKASIKGVHADADTPLEERKQIIQDFVSGKIQIITNVNIWSTGVDVPSIECIVFARPTQSKVLFFQALGRGLRTSPGKDSLLLLDHTQNFALLGSPYSDHPADMEDRPKGARASASGPQLFRQCPNCFYLCPVTAKACEACGNDFPVQMVETADGEFMTLEEYEKNRKVEDQKRKDKVLLGKAKWRYQKALKEWKKKGLPIPGRYPSAKKYARVEVKTKLGAYAYQLLYNSWRRYYYGKRKN